MSSIRIERLPIQTLNLGRFGGDHLQLVFQQDEGDNFDFQDRWFVLEGLFDGASIVSSVVGVSGADGFKTLSQANGNLTGQALLDVIHDPAWRGSHIIPTEDAFGEWQAMMGVGHSIDQQAYPYIPVSVPGSPYPISNSSSVIASLLYYIGVDISQNMPRMSFSTTVGTRTLFGTGEDDEIELEWQFVDLLGGGGNDTLSGRDDGGLVERLFGGADDDILKWSDGINYLHGGQPRLDYVKDGIDTVDYRGIGTVEITAIPYPIEHLLPDFVAAHSGGLDFLYSIERFKWETFSDEIIISPGNDVITDRIELRLEEQKNDDEGDKVDFSKDRQGLFINPSDQNDIVLVQSNGPTEEDSGIWIQSVEWLVGTSGDDRIYAPTTLRGVEGGAGADLLDGRRVTPFSDLSPQGYDVELDGGGDADTIISGAGRSLATGGAGADTFVLSTLSNLPGNAPGVVEFVIADASSQDRLLIPYNFVRPETGEFEGSELLPILGGFYGTRLQRSFSDLPQDPDPYANGISGADSSAFILWQTQFEAAVQDDASQGILDFAGQIYFNRDGADLLIHIFAGQAYEETFIGRDEYEHTGIFTAFYPDSETIIRVQNFSEGMLGINFYAFDEQEPASISFVDEQGPGTATVYPGVDSVIRTIMNGGTLIAPIEERPDSQVYDFENSDQPRTRRDGTESNDTIDLSSATPPAQLRTLLTAAAASADPQVGTDVYALGGNDTIIGSVRDDYIDGGTGADHMAGGRRSDTYVVDNAGDVIAELELQGTDRVISSIDYTLGAHVERLELTGAAVIGTGNELNNGLAGNAGNNLLYGLDGHDSLHGGTGNDALYGGNGNDTYSYIAGDGHDIIFDAGSSLDRDVLRLFQITTESVDVLRSTLDSSDVIVRFSDGGRVALDGFLNGGSVEAIAFADGTIWERSHITTAANSSAPQANDRPVATADDGLYTFLRDITIGANELLANDSDFDGDTLTIVSASTSTPGATITVTAEGGVRIAVGETFEDGSVVDFTYTISDGRGGTDTAGADITFFRNAAPAVNALGISDQASVEDQPWTFAVPAGTFSDADGNLLRFTATLATGAPLPAWLSFDAATRTFSGTPPQNFNGPIDLRVTASDPIASTHASFRLTVTPVDDAPVVAAAGIADQVSNEDQPWTFVIPPETFIEPDGQTLTYTAALADASQLPSWLTFNAATRSFNGTPPQNYNGTIDVLVTASDGTQAASDAFRLTIAPVNDAPVLAADTGFETPHGTPLILTTSQLLSNDTDPDGDTLHIVSVQNATNGTVALESSGRVTFTPSSSYSGSASFTYTVTDDHGGLVTAAVSLTILPGTTSPQTIVGTPRADRLHGTNNADIIDGRGGNDRLFGHGGDDVFLANGNTGRDRYDGGAGRDTILGSAGNDIIGLHRGSSSITSIEAINGGAGFDIIQLSNRRDALDLSNITLTGIERIDAGRGNDRIISSAQSDVIRGGSGEDLFVFRAGFGHDTIQDFELGRGRFFRGDTIDLQSANFANFADLRSHAHQVGDDTIITVSTGSSLRLEDIRLSALRANDFIL